MSDNGWSSARTTVGMFLGFYGLSGAVGVFFVLKWLGIAETFLDLLYPFEVVAQVIMTIAALALSFGVLGVIVVLIAANPELIAIGMVSINRDPEDPEALDIDD